MLLRFTVLASGSAGNASLIEVDGYGLLLDAGLGPRILTRRLQKIGASWENIQAGLLTHTHCDHWGERTLAHFAERKIPLYCHSSHRKELSQVSPAFGALDAAGLIRVYKAKAEIVLADKVRCRP